MKYLSLVCVAAGLLFAAPARAADPPLDLERLTVADAQSKMAAGQLTSVQLTRAYINRIAAVNARGPGLNAVRITNPRALSDASLLDLERATGKVRGPLHGVPVLVKDNLDVAGLPTTAGSVALQNSVPDRDSAVVAKLRAAGAVILGKTNLSEFANFISSTGLRNGYSSLGGQVLNPYDLDFGTSGSSAGSGAAAAAGLAAITIGTETSGSIVSPSAMQSLVGLRPTVGLVSRTGIIPISATQDTAGPMTRTVADAAAELQAIAGKDAEDPATDTAPATLPDYLTGLTTTALQGKRIGVINNTNAQYVAAVAAVQALGATTVSIGNNAPSSAAPYDVLTAEFRRDLNAYLGRLPASAPMKSLADIIAYNSAHADEALKFGQGLLTQSQAIDLSDPATNATYTTARDTQRAAARTAIDTALTTNTLDAILTPSGSMTGIGARAGYPQIVVPAGYDTSRRPVGIAFNGTAYSEAKLLAFAYAYEQATKLRRTPSELNPASWRCYSGTPRACPPGKEISTGVTLNFPLETATVADLQARMASGSLTAVNLTKAYMERIARTNTEGPSINAVRLINPKALQEAAAMDAERAAGHVRGPMHGIPVLVKDNLDAAGLPTTAGSVALENSVPDKDSPVVAKLRAAGAILLGKLNLSEFANFIANGPMPSGYSSLGGQVLNPYDADITPSGSSSGSGAAAAAGLAAVTIGTETSGSITSPAAAQSDVGLRPTVGLVSRTGILPISATQDTAGPITRTVADAAAELGAIAGKDPEDPATDTAPATVPDYLAGLTTRLDGRRIGVINSTNAQYVAAIAVIQSLGATTVTVPSPNAASNSSILNQEFKRDLAAYFSRLPASAPMKTLADVIAYNNAHPEDGLKFGQATALTSQNTDLTNPAQNAAYIQTRDTGRTAARNAIDNVLTTNNVEAIMTPGTSIIAVGAQAGYPQLGVPAGYALTTREPMGIAFTGTAYSEAKLLQLGYAYEQAAKIRRPPSEINPSLWRCVPGNAYVVARTACAPGETANADVIAGTVGGTVPATLSLSLGTPASFGAFVPGVTREYTASTTANIISTAGDAALSVSDPGRLMNGSFALAQPLRVEFSKSSWTAPVSNDGVTITFKQLVNATDALRTGAYNRTLTFTLSTTTP